MHAADYSVCCGSISNLEKVKFPENSLNFSRVLDEKNFFSKVLFLRGSGPFVRIFSEI